MIKLARGCLVEADKYERYYSEYSYICVRRDEAYAITNKLKTLSTTNNGIAKDIMRHKSNFGYNNLSDKAVYNYLKSYESIDTQMLSSKNVKGFSLSSETLTPIIQNGYAVEFLTHFLLANSLASKADGMLKFLSRNTEVIGKNKDGEELVRVDFTALQQINMRYATNSEDVIAIPKEFNQTVSAEDGYLFAFGDFEQADLKVASEVMLRDNTLRQYMREYPDSYEALGRLVADKLENTFDYKKFREDRPMAKEQSLAVIYGTKGTIKANAKEYINTFSSFLKTVSTYQEYVRTINDYIEMDIPMAVETYFGHKELVSVAKNIERKMAINKAVNFALNSPNQGTTAQIVILVSNLILDKFRQLGYRKEQISLYYTRHDEPIFKLKEEVLKDAWVFKEVETILIDDWAPMSLKFEYGYNYKQPDEELTRIAKENQKRDENKISVLKSSKPLDKPFTPLKPIYKIFLQFQLIGDKTVVTLYRPEDNIAQLILIESTDMDKVMDIINLRVMNKLKQIRLDGYAGVMIRNNFKTDSYFHDGVPVRFMQTIGPSMGAVCILSDYASTKYAKSIGDPFFKPPLQRDADFIKGVSFNGEII